jgi:hypothetical protein
MSHPIFMNWVNQTGDTFTFTNVNVQDGTKPSATSNPMTANGSSSVSADQTHNLGAGPVGSYTWMNAINSNATVSTSYKHPSGTGQTSVTVTCSSQYQVSNNGANWYQVETFTDKSLQQHDATITLYIRLAAT